MKEVVNRVYVRRDIGNTPGERELWVMRRLKARMMFLPEVAPGTEMTKTISPRKC